MKIIRYLYRHTVNIGTEEEPNYLTTEVEKTPRYSEETLAIAKREACNGEYTIEDDGEPDPEPTEQEQLRADVDFLLAMGGVL